MSDLHEYLVSDDGRRAAYRQRRRRRIWMAIDNIEPQSKRMPEADRDRFQAAVSAQLKTAKRQPFAGLLALQIDLGTTSKTAPQAHTIAKNLLDLLGERRVRAKGERAHLLYKDDAQIEALSVACRHGEKVPWIRVKARRFSDALDDVELAKQLAQSSGRANETWMREQQEEDWIDSYRDCLRDEERKRAVLGDDGYAAHRRMTRWYAQRAALKRSGLDAQTLGWMYARPKTIGIGITAAEWAAIIRKSPLRMQIGDLPIKRGEAGVFKQSVAREIARFKQQWAWLIDPLSIAVGVEVVVRPNPATPAAVLHDLDNVVREYLLPRIVPAFDIVSDHRWRIDLEELARIDPKLAAAWGEHPTPPKSTRSGVTRYEAWRLPPVPGEPGFVSVALVADTDGHGGLLDRIDDETRKWERDRGRRRSRSGL
jgi:hypothetical protein